MRSSILGWSAVSGGVIGLIVGVLLIGATVLILSVVPPSSAVVRSLGRRAVPLSVALVAAFVTAGSVVGYLEGRLKLD